MEPQKSEKKKKKKKHGYKAQWKKQHKTYQ
jgi:hypothetical protein